MSQIKRASLLSIALLIALMNTACVSNRVEWEGGRSSAIKEYAIKSGKVRTKVWLKEPNMAVEEILVRALDIEKYSKQSGAVGKFLGGMKLNNDMAASFNSQDMFESVAFDGKYDLNVLLSYGLSDDLQVAGVHASISVSSFSNDGELTRCSDEFEVLAHTHISKTEEPLLGRDTRLVNSYFFLRKLFVSLARDAAILAQRFYRSSDSMVIASDVGKIDILTYDDRLIKGLVAGVFSPKVIAYRENDVVSSRCNAAHFVSFGEEYREALVELALAEDHARSRQASMNKFKSQQQFRNQQLLYKRMNDRLLDR